MESRVCMVAMRHQEFGATRQLPSIDPE